MFGMCVVSVLEVFTRFSENIWKGMDTCFRVFYKCLDIFQRISRIFCNVFGKCPRLFAGFKKNVYRAFSEYIDKA